MVKRVRRIRRGKVSSKKRLNVNALTPEIMSRLRLMPVLPDGRPNPLYMPLQQQPSQNTDIPGYLKLQDANHRLQDARGANVELKKSIELAENDIKSLKKENKRLEKEKLKMETEKDLLAKKAKLNESKDRLIHDLGLADLAKEVDEMEQSKQNYQERITRVKQDLEKNKRYTELNNIKKECEELALEYEKLGKELTEADMIDVHILQVAQNERDELERKIELKKKARETQIDIAVKKQLIESLEADPALRLQKFKDMTAERDTLNESIEQRKNIYGKYQKYLKTHRNSSQSDVDKWWTNKRKKSKLLPQTIDWFESITNIKKNTKGNDYKTLGVPGNYMTVEEKARLKRLDTDIAALETLNKNIQDTAKIEAEIHELDKTLDDHNHKLTTLRDIRERARKLAGEYLEKSARVDALMQMSANDNLDNELLVLRRKISEKERDLKDMNTRVKYHESRYDKLNADKLKEKELSDEILAKQDLLSNHTEEKTKQLNDQIRQTQQDIWQKQLELDKQNADIQYLKDLHNQQNRLINEKRTLDEQTAVKLNDLEDKIEDSRKQLIEYEGNVLVARNLKDNMDNLYREHAALQTTARQNNKLGENLQQIRELCKLGDGQGAINRVITAYVDIVADHELHKNVLDNGKSYYADEFAEYIAKRKDIIDDVNYIKNFKEIHYNKLQHGDKVVMQTQFSANDFGNVLTNDAFDPARLPEDNIKQLAQFIRETYDGGADVVNSD